MQPREKEAVLLVVTGLRDEGRRSDHVWECDVIAGGAVDLEVSGLFLKLPRLLCTYIQGWAIAIETGL